MVAALTTRPTLGWLARGSVAAVAAACLAWMLAGAGGSMGGTMGLSVGGFLLTWWAPMVGAMMLPSALLSQAPAPRRSVGCLAAGYALPWLVLGVIAYWWLRGAADLTLAAPALASGLGVAVLVAAAAYQFAPRKAWTLERGRAGCFEGCAPLIAALLVIGLMSLPAMLAMVAIPLAERTFRGLLVARLTGLGMAVLAVAASLDPSLLAGVHAAASGPMLAGHDAGSMGSFFCHLP